MTVSAHGNLARLGDFSGREPRRVFWPYAGAVIGVLLLAGNALMIPAIVVGFVFVPPSALGAILPALLATLVIVVAHTVLLAAAITRRLHDRGRRGTWALPPLVLLLAGLALMVPVAQTAEGAGGPGLLIVTAGVVLLYFAALAAVVVLLVLPGDEAENRFGPPTSADVSTPESDQRGTERQT